jgi:hypothetical protein
LSNVSVTQPTIVTDFDPTEEVVSPENFEKDTHVQRRRLSPASCTPTSPFPHPTLVSQHTLLTASTLNESCTRKISTLLYTNNNAAEVAPPPPSLNVQQESVEKAIRSVEYIASYMRRDFGRQRVSQSPFSHFYSYFPADNGRLEIRCVSHRSFLPDHIHISVRDRYGDNYFTGRWRESSINDTRLFAQAPTLYDIRVPVDGGDQHQLHLANNVSYCHMRDVNLN